MIKTNQERIKPVIGEEYPLEERAYPYPFGKTLKKFKGFYIGRVSPANDSLIRMKVPEGHVFVALNNLGKLDVYCIRNQDPEIKVPYEGDLDEGPFYPTGFEVERVASNLSKLEEEFLLQRMEVWEQRKKVA